MFYASLHEESGEYEHPHETYDHYQTSEALGKEAEESE
jgi:hypothetical protein